MGKLPKNPHKGQTASVTNKGRKITFQATGQKARPWKITANKKA